MWVKVGEVHLIGPELVQETNEEISQIKNRLKVARAVRFGKKRKLAPRFVEHFEIIEKCLADPTLQLPLDEIRFDDKMKFVEEPMEILEREFKKLKHCGITIVKVWWNLKCGPEFTWKHED
uniref:Reverse transcriptase domain-containing protein n=1 Tax=Tanacetum cinerariifolium TaxID=118510 RepID=A0A699H651_TANCI|nr:hypothetical protein [Tanacetum cinerariifolium]